MSTGLLVRRFAVDYLRNPVNILVLVATPVVFVAVAAPTLADIARLLGGAQDRSGVARLAAGWTAGFVAAIAMYFQVSTSREADRRMVGAGLPRRTMVASRMAVGGLLGLLGALVAVATLVASQGTGQLGRTALGTALFAAVYLGFGALVGAFVRNPVNGIVLLLFVWIVDVFFGPGLSSSGSTALEAMPTHFLSLWTVGDTRHASGLTLGLTGAWVVGALGAAYLSVIAATTTELRTRRRARAGAGAQLAAGLRAAWHGWRRTPVLWVLLVAVPGVFVWLADATTPHGSTPVRIREAGQSLTAMFDPAEIHAGTMAPVAIGALAAVAGVFIGLDSRRADLRLLLAGQRRSVLGATRIGTATAAAALAVAASLAVAATAFHPGSWAVYALGSFLLGLTYVLIGLLAGPLVGTVSGVLLAFLVTFIDLALGQSPMLRPEPPAWATFLPGYGSSRVLMDGALTPGFDEQRSLVVAVAWVVVLAVVVLLAASRGSLPRGTSYRNLN